MINETLVDLLRDGNVDEANAPSVFLGSTDKPLTKLGRVSMVDAASDGEWDVILSSPLKRCANVAKAMAKQRSIPCKIKKELSEYDYGKWENQLVSDIIKQSPALFEAFMQDPFDNSPPNAVSYQVFHDKVLDCWHRLLQQYQGQKILLVTHGGPMRSILGEVLAMKKQANLRIEVPAACLTRIRSLGADWPTMLVFHNAQSARISDLEKLG